MTTLRFKRQALAELEQVVAEYEAVEAGLGARFAHELLSAIDLALTFPQMHPELPVGVRRIILPRFPYTVYYRYAESVLTVQAVLHGHIDPASRDRRIDDE